MLDLNIQIQEIDFSDQRLRYESEIDVLKVKLLKFESDLNQETEQRRVAENEAQAAKSVAQNLLRESHSFITKGLEWPFSPLPLPYESYIMTHLFCSSIFIETEMGLIIMIYISVSINKYFGDFLFTRTELSGSQKLAVTLADDNEKLKGSWRRQIQILTDKI